MRIFAGMLMTALVFTFTPASAVSTSTYENQVISRSNVKRVEAHRVKLKAHSCVDLYAERQARWMASHRQLQHQSMRTVLKGCGLTGVSENIAYGYSSGTATVNAWMRSSAHRRNLLASKMRYVGVGAVQDSRGVWWVSQVLGTKL
ncbi:MAG: CAP domain-containing protein [Aeromicrobium sp.]